MAEESLNQGEEDEFIFPELEFSAWALTKDQERKFLEDLGIIDWDLLRKKCGPSIIRRHF